MGGGGTWTNYVQNPDGSFCSTACSGTWPNPGSCQDSCGGVHPCTPPPPPAQVQGYRVSQNSISNYSWPPVPGSLDTSGVDLDGGGYTYVASPYILPTNAAAHTAGVIIPAGYSVGFTKCDSTQPNCGQTNSPSNDPNGYHFVPPTGLGFNCTGVVNLAGLAFTCTSPVTTGTTPQFNPPTGGYANYWFHFCSPGSWTQGVCIPNSGTCGAGKETVTDNCGNSQTGVTCNLPCTYWQTFGGDVVSLGALTDYNLPASEFVCRR